MAEVRTVYTMTFQLCSTLTMPSQCFFDVLGAILRVLCRALLDIVIGCYMLLSVVVHISRRTL